MFQSIFCGHIVQDIGCEIVEAAILIHNAVSLRFLPSAVKFMYNWNLREYAQIFQGCCRANSDYYIKPVTLVRMRLNECFLIVLPPRTSAKCFTSY